MKISEVIDRLEKIKAENGDIEVMFTDPNSSGGPFGVTSVSFEVAEEDQYPEEFDMPEGFKFVDLGSW